MYDLIIRGGLLVDGTGAPPRPADIAIRDGRIALIGQVDGPARREIDASGRVVAPGFIDIHTHYDAQLLWDGTLSPSPLHGVTTVIAGNCGISLAPARPEDRDFLVRLLSRVEAIPIESLRQGIEFGWDSFPGYLDHVAGQKLAINVGVMVGHAAVRRYVMGEDGSKREATPDEIAAMRALVDEALGAGAIGFSSSTARTQFDGDERPTPPQFAAHDEFVALAAACRDHVGTSLEFIPGTAVSGFPGGDDIRLLADMSREAGRPVNWNTVLLDYPGIPDIQDRQLDAVDAARAMGGFVVPQIIPHNFRIRIDLLESDIGFRNTPEFAPLYELDYPARIAALRDPAWRGKLIAVIESLPEGTNKAFFSSSLPKFIVSDAGPADMQSLVGRKIADIAAERGSSVLETIFDLAAEAKLEIGFQSFLVPVETEEQRALRKRVLRDKRLMLGASDGGAHVRSVINVEYPTACFGELVRDEGIFSLEELVQEFTDIPAKLYGLKHRGRLAEGYWADIVIFDAATIRASPLEMRFDFPGGAPRLYNHGVGIDLVLVAGEEAVRDGAMGDARAGKLLRSGEDTEDVPWSEMLVRGRAD
jgi:N-acyl-D-aspartate/D-glutamate deacylase